MVAATGVVVLATPGAVLAAPPPPSAPSPSDIGAALGDAQAQAQALATQIAAQEQQVSLLSEQFDQASVALDTAQAQLARTTAELADAQRRDAAARRQLQRDAVNAYIYDVPTEGLDALFSPASETTALHDQYQKAAIGNVRAAVTELVTAEHQLAATEDAQRAQAQQAAAQATAAQQSEQAARQAAVAAQSTLGQLNGRIAQLVAQQAAAQAAAEAAAARAAASQAAKQQAAAAAAAAAQVAQTVGAGSSAAAAAAAAANLAAVDAAGGPIVIGTGSPQAATGAGLVAIQTAEKYLGVPYVWGGAGPTGFDCSGLTMVAWRAAGVALVHSAALQYAQSTPVALSAVQPGDLLFYDLDGTGIDHVVMYVGSGAYGAATIIQAAHTGTVVSFDPYWTYGLVGAGRP